MRELRHSIENVASGRVHSSGVVGVSMSESEDSDDEDGICFKKGQKWRDLYSE